MSITASKFNSRVKTIVTGLLILCIFVNAILWINGINYSYIYQRLYRPQPPQVQVIRQTILPVHIDPVKPVPTLRQTSASHNVSSTSKRTSKSTPRTAKRPNFTTHRTTVKEKTPWPPFNIPSNVRILKVNWSVPSTAPRCQVKGVGPVFVPWSMSDLTKEVKTRYEKPAPGGLWAPKDCQAVGKVAVMVPYRARPQNLVIFSHHMHYFLQKQKLDYGLFIIEQSDNKKFNRAKLFNIGYIITQMMHEYDCLVLHDIDKIPEDTSYSYACPPYPKHLPGFFRKASQGRQRQKYFSSHYYQGFFGGVSSLRKEHWLKINGMVNDYWGWGGEDDELYMRLRLKGIRVLFANEKNSKFVILYHKPDAVYSHRPMPKQKVVKKSMDRNGLNSLQFELLDIKYEPLYTHIFVKL